MEKGPKMVPIKNPFTVAPRLDAMEADIIPHESHKKIKKSWVASMVILKIPRRKSLHLSKPRIPTHKSQYNLPRSTFGL